MRFAALAAGVLAQIPLHPLCLGSALGIQNKRNLTRSLAPFGSAVTLGPEIAIRINAFIHFVRCIHGSCSPEGCAALVPARYLSNQLFVSNIETFAQNI
jgi:hypothetical protein